MRDPDRIPMVLAAVERRWRQDPDLRFGQLIANLVPEPGPTRLFAIEDGALLELLTPETEEEKRYILEEPTAAREGWLEWERLRAQHHQADK